MITGIHALMFSNDADAVRTFLRDVLELDAVDAGDGWLIFAFGRVATLVLPDDSRLALYEPKHPTAVAT